MSLQAQNRQIEELLAQRQEARSGEAARRATEPERETAQRVQDTLEQRRQRAGELAVMLETWRTEYENRIVEALKTTLATYGHTLVRAAENEAVTLLFEQGNDEAHNITLTVPRGRLGGPDQLERSKQAIRVSRGTNEMSDALRTQVSIMNEIIAESFRDFGVRREGEAIEMLNQVYALAGTGTSGSSRARYLPGYGVIFNRSARMSSVLTEADVLITTDEPARAGTGRNSFRTILDDPEQFQARLEEHFEALMLKTAEILATYGSTLTELAATDWIGFNYDVGSGAALLQSGVSTFLVQARMSDVRQAASQTAPAQWLYGRLVTNKKPE